MFSEVSWAVLARFSANEKHTKYFFDNIAKYKALYGAPNVDAKVSSVMEHQLQDAIKTKDNAKFADLLKMVDKYTKDDPAGTRLNFRLAYYNGIKDWNKYSQALDDFIKKSGFENADEINSICWGLYENCDDKKLLTKACGYMEEAVTKEPKYANMDTYAALLYKSAQMKQAEIWADKAIATGKSSGENTSSTEELLAKIKAGK